MPHSVGLILHIATAPYTIAVVQNGSPLACQSGPITRPITDHLMVHIQAVVAQAGLTLKELDFIATTQGPGGYTSTRIGITTVKTMAMALEIPLYAISTLEATVWSHSPHTGLYLSLLMTRPEHYVGQLFRINQSIVEALSDLCTWTTPQLVAKLTQFTTPITLAGDFSKDIVPPNSALTLAPTPIDVYALTKWLDSQTMPSEFNKIMPIYAYEVS